MAKEDRDVLRFLWVKDIKQQPPQFCTFRFARVIFGVSSSPFLLNTTIKHHLEQFRDAHPHLVDNLLRSTYVDDIVTGAEFEEQAFELYNNSKEILKQGGFNLRKFVTNSPTLQEKIEQKERVNMDKMNSTVESGEEFEQSYAESTLGKDQSTTVGEHKILGVRWNPETDQLIFDFSVVAQLASTTKATKRNIVSIVGKLYDPLGFISPVVVRLKIFFQTLCESKIGWDEPLPETLNQQWKRLVQNLQDGHSTSLPRTYFNSNHSDIKSCYLCGFCDASTKAYAAVIYLVVETTYDHTATFVTSKTRVAPIRQQTIPRLELLSALLLARLLTTVIESLEPVLPLSTSKCFTDSQIALYWIQGIDREWKPFIQNRVKEIRRLVPATLWRHCTGKSNPADLPSHGPTPLELSVSQLWRRGPEWLNGDLNPTDEDETLTPTMPEECAKELKLQLVSSHNMVTSEQPTRIGNCNNCEDYSSMLHLRRITAFVLRAVKAFKSYKNPDTSRNLQSSLSTEELIDAEKLWVADAQISLTENSNFARWKRQLGLYSDKDGLLRCGGRLENAGIPFDTKHPLLLSKKHPITRLIVREAHERVQHNGVRETLTELRGKFWVIKGRSLVRSMVYRCVTCRRFEGAACQAPPPPPLPSFRVNEVPPFSYTGVDFAGPFYVQVADSTSSKVWLCLFTCCVTRAVHLDIVSDLSTGTFIRCLKRFASRRGLPRMFISDNGKTFKAASNAIASLLNDVAVHKYLSSTSVKWSFNVEKAPWWGGFFERMVKSVKRCLRKMIGQAKFTLDELVTAVVEVEGIVNSRPLSYVSPDDLEEPLTPSHLLMGRRVLSLPDNLDLNYNPEDEDFELTSTQLSRRIRHLNNLLNHFWKRWRNEYLLELRDSHRQSQGVAKPSVKIGDIVFVHEENLPRGFWKLAKIEELLKGRDGQIRAAAVRTSTKNSQPILLRRPLQLLYPLEIHPSSSTSDSPSTTSDSHSSTSYLQENTPITNTNSSMDSPTNDQVLRRPRRAAAVLGNERRQACSFALEGND